MSTQAKVALHKSQHPEWYCSVPHCLWRTVVSIPTTGEMKPAKDCVDGYCPRHQNLNPHHYDEVLKPILRAARTKGFFFAAMREHGVL